MTINPLTIGAICNQSASADFSTVNFLAHFEDAGGSPSNTVNSSPRGASISFNGTASLTAAGQYGSALNVTGASTSYAVTGPSSAYTIGTGDFTLEASIFTASPSQNGGIVGGDGTNKLGFYISGGGILFRANNSSLVSGGTILTSTWQRLGVGRSGTTCRAWVDGVQIGTISSAVNFDLTTMRIGTDNGISFFFFTGKIDEVRLTIGRCRYQGNYTVATAAFPDS